MVVQKALRSFEQLVYMQQVGLKANQATCLGRLAITVNARGTQHKRSRTGVFHACSPSHAACSSPTGISISSWSSLCTTKRSVSLTVPIQAKSCTPLACRCASNASCCVGATSTRKRVGDSLKRRMVLRASASGDGVAPGAPASGGALPRGRLVPSPLKVPTLHRWSFRAIRPATFQRRRRLSRLPRDHDRLVRGPCVWLYPVLSWLHVQIQDQHVGRLWLGTILSSQSAQHNASLPIRCA